MDSKQASMLTVAGGAAMAVGSFLAWASAFGISVTGIDGGDGWFTLIAGLVLAAAGYMAYSGKPLPMWLGWVALIVGAGVAVLNLFDIMDLDGVSIGIGMWLILIGSALGAVGLLAGRKA